MKSILYMIMALMVISSVLGDIDYTIKESAVPFAIVAFPGGSSKVTTVGESVKFNVDEKTIATCQSNVIAAIEIRDANNNIVHWKTKSLASKTDTINKYKSISSIGNRITYSGSVSFDEVGKYSFFSYVSCVDTPVLPEYVQNGYTNAVKSKRDTMSTDSKTAIYIYPTDGGTDSATDTQTTEDFFVRQLQDDQSQTQLDNTCKSIGDYKWCDINGNCAVCREWTTCKPLTKGMVKCGVESSIKKSTYADPVIQQDVKESLNAATSGVTNIQGSWVTGNTQFTPSGKPGGFVSVTAQFRAETDGRFLLEAQLPYDQGVPFALVTFSNINTANACDESGTKNFVGARYSLKKGDVAEVKFLLKLPEQTGKYPLILTAFTECGKYGGKEVAGVPTVSPGFIIVTDDENEASLSQEEALKLFADGDYNYPSVYDATNDPNKIASGDSSLEPYLETPRSGNHFFACPNGDVREGATEVDACGERVSTTWIPGVDNLYIVGIIVVLLIFGAVMYTKKPTRRRSK